MRGASIESALHKDEECHVEGYPLSRQHPGKMSISTGQRGER